MPGRFPFFPLPRAPPPELPPPDAGKQKSVATLARHPPYAWVDVRKRGGGAFPTPALPSDTPSGGNVATGAPRAPAPFTRAPEAGLPEEPSQAAKAAGARRPSSFSPPKLSSCSEAALPFCSRRGRLPTCTLVEEEGKDKEAEAGGPSPPFSFLRPPPRPEPFSLHSREGGGAWSL